MLSWITILYYIDSMCKKQVFAIIGKWLLTKSTISGELAFQFKVHKSLNFLGTQ